MPIQSILFDSNIWDITSAVMFLHKINQIRKKEGKQLYLLPKTIKKEPKPGQAQPKLDITANRLRFRQFKPIYKKGTNYWIKKSKYPGIEYVMTN